MVKIAKKSPSIFIPKAKVCYEKKMHARLASISDFFREYTEYFRIFIMKCPKLWKIKCLTLFHTISIEWKGFEVFE